MSKILGVKGEGGRRSGGDQYRLGGRGTATGQTPTLSYTLAVILFYFLLLTVPFFSFIVSLEP